MNPFSKKLINDPGLLFERQEYDKLALTSNNDAIWITKWYPYINLKLWPATPQKTGRKTCKVKCSAYRKPYHMICATWVGVDDTYQVISCHYPHKNVLRNTSVQNGCLEITDCPLPHKTDGVYTNSKWRPFPYKKGECMVCLSWVHSPFLSGERRRHFEYKRQTPLCAECVYHEASIVPFSLKHTACAPP